MKTAEEIFNEVFDEFSTEKGTPLSFSVKAMKIYAEQAIRLASKRAVPHTKLTADGVLIDVNHQSILSLIDELE
jgi:hypothetical protein